MIQTLLAQSYGPRAGSSFPFFSQATAHAGRPDVSAARIAAICLLAGALLALIVAPPLAYGEGVSLAADVEAGFGLVQTDDPDESNFDGIGEATFNFSGEKGQFSGQIEITIADTAEELDTAEHELVWHPSPNLSIAISGHNFGIEPSEGNISVVNAPGGPVGDEEAFIDFADTGMLNVEYAAGTLKFGVALLDACVPDCGFTVDPAPSDPEEEIVLTGGEAQTAVIHLRRETEGLSFNLYLASSSGTFTESQAEGTGSAAGGGFLYAAGKLSIGFDYSAAASECATAAWEGVCESDLETTQWGVAFTLAGFGAHYYFAEEELGADSSEITNIDVVYLFDLADATVGPEYRTTTVQAVDGSETSDTFVLFGMSMEF